jgi:hypothetical protein
MTYAARSALFGWRRAVVYVLLLGLVTTTLETVVASNEVVLDQQQLQGAVAGSFGWFVAAALVVGAARWSVPRLSLTTLALVTLAIVVVTTLLRIALPDPMMSIPALSSPSARTLNANPWYLAWGQSLYSLLFVGAIAFAWRVERTNELLAQAEIARSRSEALFDQAEFASLQGVVHPAFVLRALDEMQRGYATDAAAADRLLDQLVAFLRLAMPAVRSGRSTLGAELAIARSYTHLCLALEPQAASWQWDIDGALDDATFPPLLLLPLLDALATRSWSKTMLRLEAQGDQADAVLTLHGSVPHDWLPETLLHRLRVGLRALHGGAAGVTVASGAHPDTPAISLRFPRVAQTPLDGSSTPQPPGGSAPWTRIPVTTS